MPRPRPTRRAFLTGLAAAAASLRLQASEAAPRLSAEVAAELDAAASWATSHGARLGACFIDVNTSLELGGLAAGVAENPASNEKLVTAGTLLRYWGGRRLLTTALYGTQKDGRVAELVLRGDGDPSLTSADLGAMASALGERGVREVGAVLVDQSVFDDAFVPPGFEQQPHEWAAFRAPVSAVAVDRNSVLVMIEPSVAGTAARVSFQPDGFVELDGRIATTPRGKPARAVVGLAPRGDHLVAHLGGSIASGQPALKYRQRVEDPRLLAGYALRTALATAGIRCDGTLLLGGASEHAELVVHRSRPLAELLPELGKNSDNFYAETLLKALAAATRGVPGTSAAGAELATAWLKEIGAWDAGTRVTNGSGLFDTNRLSPRTLARVLATAWRDPALAPDFVNQLAVGGVDGTLKQRFTRLAERRGVLAKTGTLNDSVALSGYVVGPERRRAVAFSFIASGVHGRLAQARQHIDGVVERLADELWAPQHASSG
jgi:D-alanyl-D-alanine carboxypeptidase/D-alanyl-D-alanine-endopeptidase (penicillin-binding protein 4)